MLPDTPADETSLGHGPLGEVVGNAARRKAVAKRPALERAGLRGLRIEPWSDEPFAVVEGIEFRSITYAREVVEIPPRVAVPDEAHPPFDCSRTAPRHPREPKGEGFAETRRPGACGEGGCC